MSTLSWNCRGLGQPQTIQELTRLIRDLCPNLVFLSETRQHNDRVSNLRFRLGLNKSFVVDSVGKGGGLALFWDDTIKIDILSYGLHYIDTKIWSSDLKKGWRGTFVYREPRVQDRGVMWQLLKRIKPHCSGPWLMIGDFNEVLWSFEHFSSRRHPERQMNDFRDTLSFCNLHDIGFSWERNVKVRLDRAVASLCWTNEFRGIKLQHVVSSRSDHCPIFLSLDGERRHRPARHIFRYEVMWEREASLTEEIRAGWTTNAEFG
jgi:hypothetical protein